MLEVIIDLRERDEYEIKHVEHSSNLPVFFFNSCIRRINTDRFSESKAES